MGQVKNEPNIINPHENLKNYYSAIEEARADLFALYYIADQKMQDLGIVTCDDMWKAVYDQYITSGIMTQLVRIKLGDTIQEAHMRNRQLISQWVYQTAYNTYTNAIVKAHLNNKTYYVIKDYNKVREFFGELLCEVQRVKSQGDFEGAKALVEGYGVQIDQELHKEVLDRYSTLNIKPYGAFINPILTMNENKEVIIDYPTDFTSQMLYYSANFSYLN